MTPLRTPLGQSGRWGRSAGLAAVVVACALAGSPPAHAGDGGLAANGSLVFAGKRLGKPAIFARAPEDGPVRVIPTRGWARDPAVSPGGRRVAFARHGRLGSQIWTTYTDGAPLVQLTAGPTDAEPAWSPTGQAVAFARDPAGRRDLYSVRADGSGLRRLTYAGSDDRSPTWSVGHQVAFVRRIDGGDDIFVIPSSGGAARRITRSAADESSPAWSPTGKTLVVARGQRDSRDLYLLSADGSRTRRITALPGDESEPAWSPDGRWIAFVQRRRGRTRLLKLRLSRSPIRRLNAHRVQLVSATRLAPRSPQWQPTGLDPVVAAAGDIACDPGSQYFEGGLGTGPFCRQRRTSDLLLRMDLDAVLAVGDLQYDDGKLWKFQQSFDPSWGQLRPLVRPVPGNHEYQDPGAAGYFDYFNGVGSMTGQAGERGRGYYSFDVDSWHVVALNSECDAVGGCAIGSEQEQWLRQDLASHPQDCTLAFWHHPRFTSGRNSAEGEMRPMWDALYEANVELVVNGHEHFYERFAAQRPDGTPDPERGIRQFTVGTGGKSRFAHPVPAANSEVWDNRSMGVLKLTLGHGEYRWEFLRTPGGQVADAGVGACH